MRTFISLLLTALGCWAGPLGFNNPAPSLQYGLVGWWTMNEGSGTTTVDRSGHGLTATLTNTWGLGVIGNAIVLNGSNQYGTVATNSLLSPGSGDFSIGLWFTNSVTTGWQDLVRKYGVVPDNTYAITVGLPTAGRLSFTYRCTGSFSAAAEYNQTVAANGWHNVACVRSGTTATMYVDGVSVTNASNASLANIDCRNGGPLQIGCYADQNNANRQAYFNGRIDDVRIYNRALSADEVKQLYGGGYGSQ